MTRRVSARTIPSNSEVTHRVIHRIYPILEFAMLLLVRVTVYNKPPCVPNPEIRDRNRFERTH
jgi:hypothetical protein